MPFISASHSNAASFSLFKRSMMQNASLPLSDVIDDQRWQQTFDEHEINFGSGEDDVYTPAITLWALISQVFFSGEQRSCKAAVIRVASLCAALGRRVCSTNTSAYCRARLKIPFIVIRDIVQQIAADAEAACDQNRVQTREQSAARLSPSSIADVKSRSTGGRILLVDGFTLTAADTPKNQRAYPQNPTQKPGLGFPVLRCVSLISMTTGLLVDLVSGPYSGKGSGETALFWQMLDALRPGDTLVADSYYCTYWLVSACRARGVQVLMKNHHLRDDHPQAARRLSKRERLVTWSRPLQRPAWMTRQEFWQQPLTLTLRLVDVQISQPGYRAKTFTIATTITDRKAYPARWIAAVYQSRWLIELDIRSIKCSLGMDILRAKSPDMVLTELWSCLLAYNLIRLKMLQSSLSTDRDPRSLSFATTQQMLAASWLLGAVTKLTDELVALGQQVPSSERVGHRTGRTEPRANKRRTKVLALLKQPRYHYHQQRRTIV
ncbi:IS4 family transposase [Gimesia fumaroli]|uniref:Transposase DDE domain protein n=3 Tax=Gimesia fumaroli TaxID=2527976 RepID=A0A518I540_9PLAN|nr:IS4 family transposase [Gimesia fumaroli]QDV48192.1 Transposase DDE domain protein [Gimesia fumaroli]QDV48206.1 Transposase DDE domain protein [Gimesia fumaroli]